ncbi:MAG: riboflavin synthase subunit alpha [Leptolyngbyaceae cyanobacterium bins.349]|nr:riboflavin synthase subunit alpha [Leptolyngbyaceae cyanobacterium bins.349]
MFLFLLMLGGAIAASHLYYTRSDEISRLITGLLSLLCLLLSLIYAPWIIKVIAMIAIVFRLPSYRQNVIE